MNILFTLKEGMINLKRARLSAVVSILSISLALSLIGISLLAGENLRDIFDRVYQQVEIEVFLQPGVNAGKIKQLRKKLARDTRVTKVIYISREKALEEFQKNFGEDLSTIIEENPLPASFRIILDPANASPKLIEKFVAQISQYPEVQEVLYQKEIINFLHKYFRIAAIAASLFALLLFVVITILIFNTIRLTIHSRRDIIQIMRLVGATNWFIKSPFLIEGMIQGIAGGIIASGILYLFTNLVRDIIFPRLMVPDYMNWFLLGIGIFLGWIGSYISVNRYLDY